MLRRCSFTLLVFNHKAISSMSSRTVSKLVGESDKQLSSGTINSSNLYDGQGQHFKTDKHGKKENESTTRTCSVLSTNKVDLENLSEEEKEIYFAHKKACEKGDNMYQDPATGYAVFTETFHRQRGSCCGNACRHCPFNHENVPLSKRTARFNSAFYI